MQDPVLKQTAANNIRNTNQRALCSPGQHFMESLKTLCAEENIVSNIEMQTEAG